MGLQDLIALIVVLGAVLYAGRSFLRTLKGESGCATGCGCAKSAQKPDRQLKQIPLVQVGGTNSMGAQEK